MSKKLKGIKREIYDLEKKIARVHAHMAHLSDEFWDADGICCEGCGIRGWHDMEEAQERRRTRLEQLKTKLARDTGKLTLTELVRQMTQDKNLLDIALWDDKLKEMPARFEHFKADEMMTVYLVEYQDMLLDNRKRAMNALELLK